jgi:hypothetical protein
MAKKIGNRRNKAILIRASPLRGELLINNFGQAYGFIEGQKTPALKEG